MKRILLTSAVALLAIACTTNNKEYEVVVNIDSNLPDFENISKVAISNADTTLVDTAVVINGQATLKGKVDALEIVRLKAIKDDDKSFPITTLYLENSKYDITVSQDEKGPMIDIKGGGELQQVKDSLDKEVGKVYESFNAEELQQMYYNSKDENLKDSIRNIFAEKGKEANEIVKGYLDNNPNSLYALFSAYSEREFIKTDSLKQLYEKFAAVPALNNKMLNSIKEVLDKKMALAKGQQAPDFTLNDPNDNPITFSEFYSKNKITMIDFWASWCGPCRNFNPTLTQIYAKYKDKGFGIIGVSLDRNKEAWVKAIADDKLVWTHVSDLKYWQSEAGKLYNIKSIPQSYFVDQDGKILLQAPDEEEIEKLLEEILQ